MTVRKALRLAARDLYANSWRLLALNATLSAVVLALLAAGAVAAVIATSNSSNAVKLRQTVYDNVNQAVDQMQQLVDDNTR